jgi:hypothetical protein
MNVEHSRRVIREEKDSTSPSIRPISGPALALLLVNFRQRGYAAVDNDTQAYPRPAGSNSSYGRVRSSHGLEELQAL